MPSPSTSPTCPSTSPPSSSGSPPHGLLANLDLESEFLQFLASHDWPSFHLNVFHRIIHAGEPEFSGLETYNLDFFYSQQYIYRYSQYRDAQLRLQSYQSNPEFWTQRIKESGFESLDYIHHSKFFCWIQESWNHPDGWGNHLNLETARYPLLDEDHEFVVDFHKSYLQMYASAISDNLQSMFSQFSAYFHLPSLSLTQQCALLLTVPCISAFFDTLWAEIAELQAHNWDLRFLLISEGNHAQFQFYDDLDKSHIVHFDPLTADLLQFAYFDAPPIVKDFLDRIRNPQASWHPNDAWFSLPLQHRLILLIDEYRHRGFFLNQDMYNRLHAAWQIFTPLSPSSESYGFLL